MSRMSIDRIVDANLNRLTEALRVVEDAARFGLESRLVLQRARQLRSGVGREVRALRRQVILSRDSRADPGRPDRFDRMRRRSLADVLMANCKRAEEAARVLEEVLKVGEPKLAARMKEVRFRLYDLERLAVAALAKSEASRA